MKKFLSMLLVFSMLIGMAPAVFAAENVSGTVEVASGKTYTTETWTADADGVLTVSLSSDNGLGYKVFLNDEQQALGWQGFCLSTDVEVVVETGDKVYLVLTGKTTSWGNTDSTITYAFAFNSGTANSEYEYADGITEVGTYAYEMIANTDMTVVEFCPTEAGTYKIEATAEIAQVGSTYVTTMWADAEKAASLEWTCSSVGQSVIIGFASDVTLTVSKTGEASTEPAYETIVYENVATPVSFDHSVYENLTYVNVSDGIVDTAVAGDDGYYHLNSADGAILYVSFAGSNTSTVGLSGAWGYGAVKYVEYVDGEIASVTDYQDALGAYMLAQNVNGVYTYGNSYHPLTIDLITMLKNIGANNDWYGEEGWVGASEDAWMFSCLTMDLIEEEEDDTLAGSGTDVDPYIIPSLPYDLSITYANEDAAWEGAFYQYTAEQTGYIEVANLADDFNTGTLVENESWTMLTDGAGLSVTEGDVILFYHWGTEAKTYDLTLQYGTAPEGGEGGEGGEGEDPGEGEGGETIIPDSGEWSGTDVAVAADETIKIVYTPETDGVLSVAISCETGWQVDFNGESAYYSDIDESPVTENLTAGTTYTITIYPYDEADGWTTCDAVMTYELTWTAAVKENAGGSGTDEDPYILTVNADNYANVQGDIVWFNWTATADGTLDLTFNESDPAPYVVIYLNGIQYRAFESVSDQWTATADLAEGDVIYITIETYEVGGSADYTFYASFTTEGGEGDEGGDEPAALTLVDGDNELYLNYSEGSGSNSYTYTATQAGTLYLTSTFLGYDYGWGITDDTDWIADSFDPYWGNYSLTINGETAEFYYYGSVEVNEGDVVTVVWAVTNPDATFEHYLTLNLNYEGYDLPVPGSIDAPYEVYTNDIDYGLFEPAEVAAGESVFYMMYGFFESLVSFTGEGDFQVKVASYEYDEDYNEVIVWNTYTAEDGKVEFYASAYSFLVEVVNNSDAAKTYEIAYRYPLGHPNNPHIIVGEGTWTASVEANSNGYYFQWSADEDRSLSGMMTVTVSGSDGSWMYSVTNEGQGVNGDFHYSKQDGVDTEEWSVFTGDFLSIFVNTDHKDIENYDYDTPAGELTITITFVEQELVQGVDYPYTVDFYDIRYYDVIPEAPVAAGSEAWVNVTGFNGYYLVVNGAGASVEYDGVTYTDEDADGVLKIMINDSDVDITLKNTSSGDVTYTFGYSAELGHELNPVIITENGEYSTKEFEEGSSGRYYFLFTAPATGTITVEVLNDTYWLINLWNKTSYASGGGSYKYAESKVFTMDVAAGDVVSIYGSPYSYDTYSNVAGKLSFNFTFEELTADPGTEENPYVIQFADCYVTPVETVEIAAGTTVYYALKGFYGNIAVVTGEGAYIIYNGETYTAENGVIELVADDTTMLVQIGNSGEEAAVFTVGGVFPLGSNMNPEEIGVGQTVVEVEENDEPYYTSFTAECDGLVTVTISGSDWQYMIYNITTGQMFYDGDWTYMGQWTSCTSTEDSDTVTFDVKKGEEIQIVVNTVFVSDGFDDLYGSSAAGTIYIDLEVEYDHVDEDPADGFCDICGTEMETVLLGDVNGDGMVDIFDALMTLDYATGALAEGVELDLVAADVNNDGVVDIFDALIILDYATGAIDKWPENN